ncbi:TonB-dependent receptor [candidate division KSB1 bacterium]|nr:TonB-dependent receptor [candidate division KSB1 bacterium]
MNKKNILFLILCALFVLSQLYAATTGKITGVITDTETKEPMPGVNVVLDGTNIGAATDLNGRYIILNVRPGNYVLKVSMIGYKTHVVQNVSVSIGLTTTINIQLQQTVLDAGEEVTVIAERPLVRMDMTSSLVSVGAREIEDLPVQTVNDVLTLQAGVVDAGGLHIRGGRSSEIAYWVDGVATTNQYSGGSMANIENAAIQELQVISGTFNAEYGQAMSGIVNIITKDGGPSYHGQIKGYAGDYFSTADIYNVLTKANVARDSLNGVEYEQVESENPLKKFNPIYDGELSLSGPVPFLDKKVTFFTNLRYYESEGYLYGRRWYLPQGIPGDSALVNMNPSKHYTTFGKLAWRINPSMKLSYSGNYNDWQNDRHWDRAYRFVPDGTTQSFGNTLTQILTLNHVLSPKTFYEVKLNRLYSESTTYLYEDPTKRPHYFVQVYGDSTMPDTLFDPDTESGAALLNLVKQDPDLDYEWIVDPNNAEGYVHPDMATAPASYSYLKAGTPRNHSYNSTAYWIAKFDLISQVNEIHQLKVGTEVRLHEVKRESFTLQPALDPVTESPMEPYTPVIPDISTIYYDNFTRTPKEFSAYVQDKLELADINLNIGLRFDYFDPNSVIPADPTDINIYDPYKDENKYRNPEAPDSLRVEYSPEERRAWMHKKVDPKMQVSPRLGIAYPITDKGVIHFSYGHFFQMPNFSYLYDSPDFKLNSGGGLGIIGNADLNAQKTVQYEIGLQQEIYRNVGIDVTLFYKDIRDWIDTSPPIRTARHTTLYSKYINRAYANVRGITVKLEKRYSHNIYAKVDYSFQFAEGTYSNPNDAFNAYSAKEEPRLSLIRMNWDRRHTLNGQVMWSRKELTVSLIGKLRSGLPYTPVYARGAFVGGQTMNNLTENSQSRPNYSEVDMYVTKKFRYSGLEWTVFMYAYNLFDQRGQTGVFADTGVASYTTDPNYNNVALDPNRVGTVKDYYTRPEYYISPRRIQLGLSIGF